MSSVKPGGGSFVRDGEALLPQPWTKSGWGPNMLMGRYLAGLIAYGAEQHATPEFQPGRMTVDMFRPAPLGPTLLDTRVVRDGRRIRVVDVDVIVAEEVVCLGAVVFIAALRLTLRIFAKSVRPRLPILFCAAVLASVPQTLFSRFAAIFIWPEVSRLGPPLWLWYFQVLLVFIVLSLGLVLTMFRSTDGDVIQNRHAPFSELNQTWPEAVIALQMEDHYVRVHRADGSDLILMTMREAMARTGQADGCQPHRSWWVARRAVKEIVVKPRSMRLLLTNGLLVPVARNRVALLRSKGWLI